MTIVLFQCLFYTHNNYYYLHICAFVLSQIFCTFESRNILIENVHAYEQLKFKKCFSTSWGSRLLKYKRKTKNHVPDSGVCGRRDNWNYSKVLVLRWPLLVASIQRLDPVAEECQDDGGTTARQRVDQTSGQNSA